MRRYRMKLLVRPDGFPGAEQEVKCNITAAAPLEARRRAMEIAWANKLLVSRFLFISAEAERGAA